MIDQWLEDLATKFWQGLDLADMFPRPLEEIILQQQQIPLISLDRLSPRVINNWFSKRNFSFPFETKERRLNGCFLACRGHSFIFVDDSLGEADRRLIVAHEFAHYLTEFLYPRRRAIRCLSESVVDIFDAKRTASPGEKLAAALTGISLEVYVHYMDRSEEGTYSEATTAVEEIANVLALELIAPWRSVLQDAKQVYSQPGVDDFVHILEEQFGVPNSWAQPYGKRLARQASRSMTFSERLGI